MRMAIAKHCRESEIKTKSVPNYKALSTRERDKERMCKLGGNNKRGIVSVFIEALELRMKYTKRERE